jgi:hypothetical protein
MNGNKFVVEGDSSSHRFMVGTTRDGMSEQRQKERGAYPVFQALRTLFGQSVDRIECDLPDSWLAEPVGQAYLDIGECGSMHTHCGDSLVVAFIPTSNKACRVNFALVVDSNLYDQWQRANAKNDFYGAKTSAEIGPCPSIILKLVASN